MPVKKAKKNKYVRNSGNVLDQWIEEESLPDDNVYQCTDYNCSNCSNCDSNNNALLPRRTFEIIKEVQQKTKCFF